MGAADLICKYLNSNKYSYWSFWCFFSICYSLQCMPWLTNVALTCVTNLYLTLLSSVVERAASVVIKLQSTKAKQNNRRQRKSETQSVDFLNLDASMSWRHDVICNDASSARSILWTGSNASGQESKITSKDHKIPLRDLIWVLLWFSGVSLSISQPPVQ